MKIAAFIFLAVFVICAVTSIVFYFKKEVRNAKKEYRLLTEGKNLTSENERKQRARRERQDAANVLYEKTANDSGPGTTGRRELERFSQVEKMVEQQKSTYENEKEKLQVENSAGSDQTEALTEPIALSSDELDETEILKERKSAKTPETAISGEFDVTEVLEQEDNFLYETEVLADESDATENLKSKF